MYISPTVIRIICAALWIGAICLAVHLLHAGEKYSKDLRNFLNIASLVMAALGVVLGTIFGMFPGE